MAVIRKIILNIKCFFLNRQYCSIEEKDIYYYKINDGNTKETTHTTKLFYMVNGCGRRKVHVCNYKQFKNHSFIREHVIPWTKGITHQYPSGDPIYYFKFVVVNGTIKRVRVSPDKKYPLINTERSGRKNHLQVVK